MRELIALVVLQVVLLRGEPRQPLLVDVHPQRVETRHYHIDPHVELVSEDAQGVVDVPAHDALIVLGGLTGVVDLRSEESLLCRSPCPCWRRKA